MTPSDYKLCQDSLVAQLRTLSDPFFPAETGRDAGWQVSDDDTLPLQGGEYFIIYRPGSFSPPTRTGELTETQWQVTLTLYVRYEEYSTAWSKFTEFRDAILDLPRTAPLKNNFIDGTRQTFSSGDEPGYLVDGQGAYTQFIVQTISCTIPQRALRRRAF